MGTVQGLRVARLRLPPMAVMAVEPVATARSKEAVRARPAGVGPRTPQAWVWRRGAGWRRRGCGRKGVAPEDGDGDVWGGGGGWRAMGTVQRLQVARLRHSPSAL
jgi:hypothetical protein